MTSGRVRKLRALPDRSLLTDRARAASSAASASLTAA